MQDGNGMTGRRTVPHLIEQLDRLASQLVFAAIAVSFGSKTMFVLASDEDRSAALVELLRADGVPTGIVGLGRKGHGLRFYSLPLPGYVDRSSACSHLDSLAEVVHAIHARSVQPPSPEALDPA